MVTTLPDAVAAAEAGADVIVAQGTEGGGHVGEIGTTVLVRQAAKALAPVPVLAAGGLADGAGLAAALALGADGILMGTRFIATDECALTAVRQGGRRRERRSRHDRHVRPRHLQRAATGREPGRAGPREPVRRGVAREGAGATAPAQARARAAVAAEERGDHDYWLMWFGQSAGLVDAVQPAGDVVRETVAEAEANPERAVPKPRAVGYNERRVAGWSSQVARRAHNPEVAGSNPAPATEKAPATGLFPFDPGEVPQNSCPNFCPLSK